MIQHSFDVGKGIYKFKPVNVNGRCSNKEWKYNLIARLAINNNMTDSEVKEFLNYEGNA